MASDAAVELAHRLRSRIWCRECLGAVPAVDTCEACGGTGCTRESLEAIRAALDAARAEERGACVAYLRTTSRASGVLVSIHSAQDIARLADDIENGAAIRRRG